jgi:seryl-tRNA synthetase
MLDARYVRDNVEQVREALQKRDYEFPLREFLAIDERRISVLKEAEELRNRRNVVSEAIGRKKRRKEDAEAELKEMRGVSDRIKSLDEQLRSLEEETGALLLTIPNVPDKSVPVGKDETENVEIRRRGAPGEFDFEPLNHWDIAEPLDIVDFERTVCAYEGRGSTARKGPYEFHAGPQLIEGL